jgi:hypothetical protein
MAVLLGSAPGGAARREAEDHVARCSDCWAVLSLLHDLAMGGPPPGRERMDALFGCGPVQDEMYRLAGLSAEQIGTRHPEARRHLSWCLACRARFAEILTVERAAARGELGAPLFAPVRPRWTDAGAKVGAAVHEAVGRVLVELRRTTAVFTAVPAGFVVSPMPAMALRGSASEQVRSGERALGQQVGFTLGDSQLSAELTLEPQGERVGMVVRVSGAGQPRLSLHVRELGPEGAELVARYTMTGAVPVVVKGLAPGRYLLEIEDKQEARRFHLRFDVEAPG